MKKSDETVLLCEDFGGVLANVGFAGMTVTVERPSGRGRRGWVATWTVSKGSGS